MSIAHDIFHLLVLFTISDVVELSVCSGVGGLGCPNYINVRRIFFLILALFNHLHHSYSAVDSTTCLIMLNMVYIAPLSLIGSVLIVVIPKKYLPPITYRPFSLYIFDASKCMFNIMSYFKYLMISLG